MRTQSEIQSEIQSQLTEAVRAENQNESARWTYAIIKETWLSRAPRAMAELATFLIASVMVITSFLYFNNIEGAATLMAASGAAVFEKHEYWRLWTALFAHADVKHLLSNLVLFVPLAYLLIGYFRLWLFPVLGFALGGLINWITVSSLPSQVSLVGVSGVVYWMGAAWLTLYLLINTRESFRRRLGKALVIAVLLFFPTTFEPQVSYMSHFLGFAFGVPSAALYYVIERKKIIAAEKLEFIEEVEFDNDNENELVVLVQDKALNQDSHAGASGVPSCVACG